MDCDTCVRYLKSLEGGNTPLVCAHVEYYTPGMLWYCRPQMMCGIEWLDLLEEGDWPRDPKETGYNEAGHVQKSVSLKAKFLPAANFFSEITDRLKSTGSSGETLVWELQHNTGEYNQLSPAARRALNYISGYRRRRQPFGRWLWEQDKKKTDNLSVSKSSVEPKPFDSTLKQVLTST